MSYHDEIRAMAMKRNIECLMHFTQLENLPSIVQHGLLARDILEAPEYIAYVGDRERLDGRHEAVSVSISTVNWRTFAAKRRKSGHDDWVILVLQPEILWTHHCLFSWRNAATTEIREHRGFRGGPWAFCMMFAGDDKSRIGLESSQPTDPEAEVQVLERIAPEAIAGAFANSVGRAHRADQYLSQLHGSERDVVVTSF